jgi:NAD(P)-dependent dehydrogenase (short-subunit alcohol dehydrogenase family)
MVAGVDIREHSVGSLSLTADLTIEHEVRTVFERVASEFGRIDVIYNNVGMGAASAQMAYNAAKAAVTQLSRDLGTNLAHSGVRVNALALGPIETPALREVFARVGPEQAARRFTHMPLGRFGTLDEIAGTVAYLASDDSGFVTASEFPINGGIPGGFTVPE